MNDGNFQITSSSLARNMVILKLRWISPRHPRSGFTYIRRPLCLHALTIIADRVLRRIMQGWSCLSQTIVAKPFRVSQIFPSNAFSIKSKIARLKTSYRQRVKQVIYTERNFGPDLVLHQVQRFNVVVPKERPSLVRKFAQYMTCFNISYTCCHIM
jgi:hypothetical protein